MLIEKVEKKLREAQFFLGKMAARQQMAFGDREEFDSYLSAFLSAGRSVRLRLDHEKRRGYGKFYANWVKSLSPDEQELMEFMKDDRDDEVHESGSKRNEKESRIAVQGHYEDPSGRMFAHTPLGVEKTEIIKPTYFFTIHGSEMSVLECGRKYVELLERLVREYRQSARL